MNEIENTIRKSQDEALNKLRLGAIVIGSYSIESEIKDKIECGLINEKLEPVKCECDSTEFIDKTTDKIDFLEVEKDRFCKKCNKLVGYWSYGHWIP
jgi:hypothetical protein